MRLTPRLPSTTQCVLLAMAAIAGADFAAAAIPRPAIPREGSWLESLVHVAIVCGLATPLLWFALLRRLRRASQRASARADAMANATNDAILTIDDAGRVRTANARAAQLFGWSEAELVGQPFARLIPDAQTHPPTHAEVTGTRRDGSTAVLHLRMVTIRDDGSPMRLAILGDPAAWAAAHPPEGTAPRLDGKLEAIGRLASGIAHELNGPMQDIGESVQFLRAGFRDLLQLAVLHDEACAALADTPGGATLLARVRAATEGTGLTALRHRGSRAFERTLEGVERVGAILRAMRGLGGPAAPDKVLTDLNETLESALLVSRHEYKFIADAETDFHPLPLVSCHAGELSQVFLTLIVNAAQAIAEAARRTGRRGRLRVSTGTDGETVVIRFSDTGTGIPPEMRHRIFDPAFPVLPPGRGGGQGLAFARSIVVGRHGGSLTVDSEVGQATTFTIRLPAPRPARPEPLTVAAEAGTV